MVKLDKEYILKKTLKKSDFTDEKQKRDACRNVNHLCLSDKAIDKIGDMSPFINLGVLYLHNNRIAKMENLDENLNLTHLYLQNNSIEKIENIGCLTKLRKLYLGNNRISVVESLDKLRNLEELYIEAQKLLPGESLYFDPRTVQALSRSLKTLDISYNRLTSLDDLRDLKSIEEVDASCNEIRDLAGTCRVITNWCELNDLKLQGNPVTRVAKYRDTITTLTHRLANLDGKPIKEEQRSFLQQFEMMRVERRRLLGAKRSQQTQFSAEIKNLADHLPAGVRSSVSSGILRETQPRTTNILFALQTIPTIKEISFERRPRVPKNFGGARIKSGKRNGKRNIPPEVADGGLSFPQISNN